MRPPPAPVPALADGNTPPAAPEMPAHRHQPSLVLASASPRRRQLLAATGLELVVDTADIDEAVRPGETPLQHVQRLAEAKAQAVAARHPGQIVLGADTVVVLDGVIFGKPADLQDAANMLRRLAGRWHDVLTGVVLVRPPPAALTRWCCRTRVRFKDLTADIIRGYCARVNTLDKAGAYGIQEHGGMLVAEIDGLYSNVVGLPVEEVLAALRSPP